MLWSMKLNIGKLSTPPCHNQHTGQWVSDEHQHDESSTITLKTATTVTCHPDTPGSQTRRGSKLEPSLEPFEATMRYFFSLSFITIRPTNDYLDVDKLPHWHLPVQAVHDDIYQTPTIITRRLGPDTTGTPGEGRGLETGPSRALKVMFFLLCFFITLLMT